MTKSKKVVLAGGCFDVLHPGHIIFLEKAKRAGDSLVVLLENDQRVKELKGVDRPIHTQKERAQILQALKAVDYVISLPYLTDEKEYDRIIQEIRPDIIAVTFGDANVYHHQRVAKKMGVRLKYVTKMVGNYSTSKILKKNG